MGTLLPEQNKIEIFADVKDNDTLQKLVTIFTDQLKKSLPDNSRFTGNFLQKESPIHGNIS
jgi:hypothetical protein